jgi:hypothetical protein
MPALSNAQPPPPNTELLMKSAPQEGQFLIRARQKKSEDLVLSVIYKGKATHHLITQEPDGTLLVNKRKYGDNKDILQVRVTGTDTATKRAARSV